MFWFLDLFDVGVSVKQAIRTFFGSISALLYDFIVDLYNIFMTLTTVNAVDNRYIQEIYNKVGLILGLFMLFKLLFSLIQYLIEPSKLSDQKNGAAALVKRFVISIVLLGFTPTIFDLAFDFQKLIVGTSGQSSNVIYRFLTGDMTYYEASSFGQTIASDLFFSFYSESYDGALGMHIEKVKDNNGWEYVIINEFSTLQNNIRLCDRTQNKDCSFNQTVDYLGIKGDNEAYAIKWDGLFSIGVAIIVIWILVMYCIQVATRVIQLAYLQIIAPIPILSYISDPEGTFKRWTSQCIATYLDLFIRLAVIYFIMTISQRILDIIQNVTSNDLGIDPSSPYIIWVKIFLIIGLLVFGKKVPELLKDLFPNMGGGAGKFDYSLKAPKPVKSLATLGAGVAVGGIAGMASGIRHGEGWRKLIAAPGGFLRGAASARTSGNIFANAKKGMANVRAANARAYERHHDGSTLIGRMTPISSQRTVDKFEREVKSYQSYDSVVGSLEKELEKNAYVQAAMAKKERMLEAGKVTEVKINKATGKSTTIQRELSAADIAKADDAIKAAKKAALRMEIEKIDKNAQDQDATIAALLNSAEAIRLKGVEENYHGYEGSVSITDSSGVPDAQDRANAFFDIKKSTKAETSEIQSEGGSRNKEYSQAKANSQYKPK